jgi:hypothetical protein
MANTTTPKDETLDPIRHCTIPQTVTQLKAFLGSTQQMAYYVPYYALVAAPLHRLTRKGETFPSGSKWIPGSDYDMAFRHVRSLVLDRPLYIWNKDNSKHLFLEVDSSDERWGACAYQYADSAPEGENETKANTFSSAKGPSGLSNGYLRLGLHTKRRVYLSFTRRPSRGYSHSSSSAI